MLFTFQFSRTEPDGWELIKTLLRQLAEASDTMDNTKTHNFISLEVLCRGYFTLLTMQLGDVSVNNHPVHHMEQVQLHNNASCKTSKLILITSFRNQPRIRNKLIRQKNENNSFFIAYFILKTFLFFSTAKYHRKCV